MDIEEYTEEEFQLVLKRNIRSLIRGKQSTKNPIAILLGGQSGAGKTTIANLLMQLLTPTEGKITVNGQDLQSIQSEWYHSQIAYLSQTPYIMSGTLRDNLQFGLEVTEKELWHVLDQVQLAEFVKNLPLGLDTMIGKMKEKGMVKDEFLLSVYKRESSVATYLNGGIAIPHGESRFVNEPCIFITKLDKPVIWDGANMADIVFLLALNENSKKYFEQLYKIISDENTVNTIRNAKTKEEILKILCKNTEPVN